MPIRKDMTHGEIVAEIIRNWKRDGMIGRIKPRNLEHALDIANAIAYQITRNRAKANSKRGSKSKRQK